MRFAAPLVLILVVVAALIFVSRDPPVLPDIAGSDKAGKDRGFNTVGTNTLQLRNAFSESDKRLCVVDPRFVEVNSADSAQTIAGVAQFKIDSALTGFSQRTGRSVDTLRTITLAVDTDAAQTGRSLDFVLAGSAINQTVNDSLEVVLRFPGHVLRNHSIVSLVVRNDSGEMLDLSGFSDWMLCGEPVDDERYGEREPVVNDVTGMNLGPGVNVMGGEYACAQGWGLQHHVAAGVTHAELANMLSVWGVKSVRLPVNEHCWLAESYPFQYLNADFTGRAYQASLQQLVHLLTDEYQLHVILDLHWTGKKDEKALELKPLPNPDYSASFWRDVAEQFAHNDRVIFNLFNEPHVPKPNEESPGVDGQSDVEGSAGSQSDEASLYADLTENSVLENEALDKNWWLIWRDGNDQYAGMQSLVDAIRGTGASNHISIGGLDYSADQRGWLTYAPHDPLGKLWVDNHAYPAGNKCTDRLCWEQTLLPLVANGYGVMFGEAGNSIGQSPQGCQADFVKKVYRFARENTIPVLAWTFVAGGVADSQSNKPDEKNCQIPTLISRWPGELINADLSSHEVEEKQSFDPTPEDLLDDATWPGCIFYAYANGLPLDDIYLPDVDPAVAGDGRAYGACSAL